MMPLVQSPRRTSDFSIESLMSKGCPNSGTITPCTVQPSMARSAVSTRDFPMGAIGSPFHLPFTQATCPVNGLKNLYPREMAACGPDRYAELTAEQVGMPALTNALLPHELATLHSHAMQSQTLAQSCNPQTLHPLFTENHRETLSYFPWLAYRHGSYLDHRFPGADPSLLLQPFRKPKRIRTAFSPSQLLKLEHAFEKNHYVVGQERKDLASNLSLTETQVKVWFQNRRTKYKRMKEEEGDRSDKKTDRSEDKGEDTRDSLADISIIEEEDSEDEEICVEKEDESETTNITLPVTNNNNDSDYCHKGIHHLNKWRIETKQL